MLLANSYRSYSYSNEHSTEYLGRRQELLMLLGREVEVNLAALCTPHAATDAIHHHERISPHTCNHYRGLTNWTP